MKTVKVETEVAISKDGFLYEINPKTKTCRRIVETVEEFIKNFDISPLEQELANANTKVLHKLVKTEFPDAVLKHNKLHVMEFKISYVSHGYDIVDLRKSGERLNINEWRNDYPTPESVLEFLRDFKSRPPEKTKIKVTRDSVEVGHLMKLQSLGKITITRKENNEMEIKEVKKVATKSRLVIDTLRLISNFKEGKYSVRIFKNKMKERLPDVLHKSILKVFDEYKTGERSYRRMNIEVTKQIETYEAERAAEKEANRLKNEKVKFEGVTLWEPVNLKWAYGNDYMIREKTTIANGDKKPNSRLSMTSEIVMGEIIGGYYPSPYGKMETAVCINPDIVWMDFDTRGPAGKMYNVKCTLEEYLAMVVLHFYPKAMPLIMQAANGTYFNFWDINLRSFIVDPYQRLDINAIRHPQDRTYFCQLCQFILGQSDTTGIDTDTCLGWVYNSGYKNGDRVMVYIYEYLQWFKATVISEEGGALDFRYEDGSTGKCTHSYQVRPVV